MGKQNPRKKVKANTVRIWHTWDVIPFGRYKGKTLKSVSEENPGYLEWWQRKNGILFSSSLKESISYNKNLGK